jgi:hypothetical protein
MDSEAQVSNLEFLVDQERAIFQVYEARLHSEETQATGLAAATIAIGALLATLERELDSPSWVLILASIGIVWSFLLASITRLAGWGFRRIITRLAGWGIRRIFSRAGQQADERQPDQPESADQPSSKGDVRVLKPFKHLAHEPRSDDETVGLALERLRVVGWETRPGAVRAVAQMYWQAQAVAAWDLAEFKHLLLKVTLSGLLLTLPLPVCELIL